jgi:hypothetical protein
MMIGTEDRGRMTADKTRKTEDGTALEDRVRARVPLSLLISHLTFDIIPPASNL